MFKRMFIVFVLVCVGFLIGCNGDSKDEVVLDGTNKTTMEESYNKMAEVESEETMEAITGVMVLLSMEYGSPESMYEVVDGETADTLIEAYKKSNELDDVQVFENYLENN